MPLQNGEPSAAEIVALANRLHALKAAPGFYDLKLIAEMMEKEATDAVIAHRSSGAYEKDRDEIFMLKLRAEVAKLMIGELFGRVEAAIANANALPGFQKEQPGEPLITTRIAGSY
jgi:hypothetical protein